MRVSIPHLLGGIGAFDVVHRDPKLTVVLSPVMDRDYVGMPQGCSDVGFTTFAVATATSSDVGGRRLGRVGVIGAVTFGCGVIHPRSLPIGARLRADGHSSGPLQIPGRDQPAHGLSAGTSSGSPVFSENISTILTPWFCLICSSWPGAANPRRNAREFL